MWHNSLNSHFWDNSRSVPWLHGYTECAEGWILYTNHYRVPCLAVKDVSAKPTLLCLYLHFLIAICILLQLYTLGYLRETVHIITVKQFFFSFFWTCIAFIYALAGSGSKLIWPYKTFPPATLNIVFTGIKSLFFEGVTPWVSPELLKQKWTSKFSSCGKITVKPTHIPGVMLPVAWNTKADIATIITFKKFPYVRVMKLLPNYREYKASIFTVHDNYNYGFYMNHF